MWANFIIYLALNFNIIFNMQDDALKTPYEKGNGNQSATYAETIAYYELLDKKFPEAKLFTYPKTDVGKPLHVLALAADGDFSPHKKGRRVLLINNGIHPGEPEGIDASMALARDLLTNKKALLRNILVLIIPVYNIDGMLNRTAFSRANQNGPDLYGFRGNARNLDLNRDFIKCDSQNALTFSRIFQEWKPDVFVDTHTSNGADYPYVMTLISTQHDKLGGELGRYLNQTFEPALYKKMREKGEDMSPYVLSFKDTPDSGLFEFAETPRYSSGYAALFHTLSFVPETHMLKPFKQRLEATYKLLEAFIEVTDAERENIGRLRAEALQSVKTQEEFPLNWRLDTARHTTFWFKGYEAAHKPSAVSGLPRLYYDQNKPYEKDVPFYNRYTPIDFVKKPYAYIIPQAWREVIERLKANAVETSVLTRDVKLKVDAYKIEKAPNGGFFEGRNPHKDVSVRSIVIEKEYYAGDVVVILNQSANRYLIETLEPLGNDSFFAWNFFDAILNQKEYFSDYVFEDLAAEMLAKNPDLRARLEQKRKEDAAFAENAAAQLDFVYKNSDYYEKTHLLYPVARLNAPVDLPIEKK